jgi:hypothetical protein
MNKNEVIFITRVGSREAKANACILINSLRMFGGKFGEAPVWVFEVDPDKTCCKEMANEGVHVFPVGMADGVGKYPFGNMVAACAQAEAMAADEDGSMVWIDEGCVVVQPPFLLRLGESWDAAVRPVHIRNVGLRRTDAVDSFWRGIYQAVGVDDLEQSVESFVDREVIRPYFNSHCFAINPKLGLMRRWFELFRRLVGDTTFQTAACQDDLHQTFLFQAILSTLLVNSIGWERLRILPPTYNYPMHLHHLLPPERKTKTMNELVSLINEGEKIEPSSFPGMEIREPLTSWLKASNP